MGAYKRAPSAHSFDSNRKHLFSPEFCVLFLATAAAVCVWAFVFFLLSSARELLLCLMLCAPTVELAAIRCISNFDVCITNQIYMCLAIRFLWFLMWFSIRLHSTCTRWFVGRGHLPVSQFSKPPQPAICQRDWADRHISNSPFFVHSFLKFSMISNGISLWCVFSANPILCLQQTHTYTSLGHT